MLRDPAVPIREPITLTPYTRRPDAGGTAGRRTTVSTNFFAIKNLEVDTIWHYDVQITPEIPAEKARKLWKVIEDSFPELPKNKTVFDGKCNAYAAEELKVEKLKRKVVLPEPGSTSGAHTTPAKVASSSSPATKGKGGAGPKAGGPPSKAAAPAPGKPAPKKNEFTVAIIRVARIDLEELHRFLRKEGPVTPSCFVAIQALNIVMSHKLFSEMVSVGRSAFTSQNPKDLGGGVEKWDGIFQSVRPGQGQLYANIDIASTAFLKGGNAVGLIADVKGVNVRELNGPGKIQKSDFTRLHNHFKGASFTVTHRGGNFQRRYKVSEVSMMPADRISFEQETNDGKKKKVTIPQYYQAAYNLRLQFPFLPCLGVKAHEGRTMYFPAEVCNMVPGRRYTKKLNEMQTAAMIKDTCVRPHERMNRIMKNFNVLDFERNQYLKGFKMEVSKEMTVVPARVLEAPKVMYANNVQVQPQFGGWQLSSARKMVQGSKLSSWGILVHDLEKNMRTEVIKQFVRELTSTLAENGMIVVQRNPPIMYAQVGNVKDNVEAMLKMIKDECKVPAEMILVVMPGKSQTYSAIKTFCETGHNPGVMTQCALSKNLYRVSKQYCGNLGLKINAKLGGLNNCLQAASIPFLEDAIVIGADVTHPSPGVNRASIAAVVGSLDEKGFRYAGRLKPQGTRVEVITDLKFLVYQLLVAFFQKRKKYPKRILFYRDGVSEGQYAEVLETEVKAIEEARDHINVTSKRPTPYDPKITFCVVKKRHHARLFPMSERDADKSGNCLAGTVVDTVITHPTEFDFYLQSHGGLQGTSRPTLYHVLRDDNGFTSDSLQTLTYRLCHVYARCTKSVSIVPAVYYAHLLAFRARHYQGEEFSDTASTASGESGASTAGTFAPVVAGMKDRMYFV